MKVNTERIKKVESTENKVKEMLKLSFTNTETSEQRKKVFIILIFFNLPNKYV